MKHVVFYLAQILTGMVDLRRTCTDSIMRTTPSTSTVSLETRVEKAAAGRNDLPPHNLSAQIIATENGWTANFPTLSFKALMYKS